MLKFVSKWFLLVLLIDLLERYTNMSLQDIFALYLQNNHNVDYVTRQGVK